MGGVLELVILWSHQESDRQANARELERALREVKAIVPRNAKPEWYGFSTREDVASAFIAALWEDHVSLIGKVRQGYMNSSYLARRVRLWLSRRRLRGVDGAGYRRVSVVLTRAVRLAVDEARAECSHLPDGKDSVLFAQSIVRFTRGPIATIRELAECLASDPRWHDSAHDLFRKYRPRHEGLAEVVAGLGISVHSFRFGDIVDLTLPLAFAGNQPPCGRVDRPCGRPPSDPSVRD